MSDTQKILVAVASLDGKIDTMDRKNDAAHLAITTKLDAHTEQIHRNDKELARVKTSWKIVSAALGSLLAIGLTLLKVLS